MGGWLMADKKQLEILSEELKKLLPDELDRRATKYLSMDPETLAAYQNEYIRRGIPFPSQEMMDH
jgi:hypothetical protein